MKPKKKSIVNIIEELEEAKLRAKHHIAVSPIGTLSTPSLHSWGKAAPAPHTPGSRRLPTKLPPYCKKFLIGACNIGASCQFVHVLKVNCLHNKSMKIWTLLFPGERQRILASRDRSQDHLSLEDLVAKAVTLPTKSTANRRTLCGAQQHMWTNYFIIDHNNYFMNKKLFCQGIYSIFKTIFFILLWFTFSQQTY